ncbi:MAG: LysM peptidoglycan-binding domain-containing protein [Chloroflexi bacterium]|nr:LysM peptidoglycan-binding domain-containing protein [Chloroflexota bacterium]
MKVPRSPGFASYTTMVTVLALLIMSTVASACTRERPPWPTTTPGFSLPTRQPTATPQLPAANRGALADGEAEQTDVISDTVTANPGRDLPPIPDTVELTPRPPTPTPEPPSFIYTVQAGDTLSRIAQRFGTDSDVIIQLNALSNPNELRVGQQLRIPGVAPANAASVSGKVHIVQPGDTLFSIAQQYGISMDALAAQNQITDPDNLMVGQVLQIPTGRGATGSEAGVRIHVVQPGETLSKIASQYGVSADAIMQANGITDPNRIIAGAQLTIP